MTLHEESLTAAANDGRERLGSLRVIYTDAGGMANISMQRELSERGDPVWALVGPIGKHISHPELQDAIGLVAMAFNRRLGHLSPDRHAELLARSGYDAGAELLREALAALSPVKP